jgi:hypothetical protein
MTGTVGLEVKFYSLLTSAPERGSKQRLGVMEDEQYRHHCANLSNLTSLVTNVLLSTVFSSAFTFLPLTVKV